MFVFLNVIRIVQETGRFGLLLEILGQTFARLRYVAAGLVVRPAVLEYQPYVADDFRVVRVLEVVYVVFDRGKVHRCFDVIEITWCLEKKTHTHTHFINN